MSTVNKESDNIQKKISDCKNTISYLQYLLDDSSKELLTSRLNKLKDSESKFCLYKNSLIFMYLGNFSFFKEKYNIMKNDYISSFEKFKHQICLNLNPLRNFHNFDNIRMRLCIDNTNSKFDVNRQEFRHDSLSCKNYALHFCLKSNLLKHDTCYDACYDISKDYYIELNCLLKNKQLELKKLMDFTFKEDIYTAPLLPFNAIKCISFNNEKTL